VASSAGAFSITGPDRRRPATLKTGTNTDAKDLNAYGYIAPPTDAGRAAGAYALAVGVWDGNSDNSLVSRAGAPLFSIDVATFEWQGFLQEASAKWPVTDFKPPSDGLVQAKIDPFTGMLASSAKNRVNEWYISGTEPTSKLAPNTCGIDVVNQVGVETRFDSWIAADRDWLARAAKGPGTVGGPNRTRTAYFYNGAFHPYGSSWGPVVGGTCGAPSPMRRPRGSGSGARIGPGHPLPVSTWSSIGRLSMAARSSARCWRGAAIAGCASRVIRRGKPHSACWPSASPN